MLFDQKSPFKILPIPRLDDLDIPQGGYDKTTQTQTLTHSLTGLEMCLILKEKLSRVNQCKFNANFEVL